MRWCDRHGFFATSGCRPCTRKEVACRFIEYANLIVVERILSVGVAGAVVKFPNGHHTTAYTEDDSPYVEMLKQAGPLWAKIGSYDHQRWNCNFEIVGLSSVGPVYWWDDLRKVSREWP